MPEQGFATLNSESWQGLFVPAKTPPEIVRQLFASATRAMQQPDVGRRLSDNGVAVVLSKSPDELASYENFTRARQSIRARRDMLQGIVLHYHMTVAVDSPAADVNASAPADIEPPVQHALRPGLAPVAFALLISVFLIGALNTRFWTAVYGLYPAQGLREVLFLGSLFAILVVFHAGMLLLMPGTRVLKTVSIVTCIAGATGAYFSNSYGVFIDREMMRNVLQTDIREAVALGNVRFAAYILLLGVIPSVLIMRTRVRRIALGPQVFQRLRFIACAVLFGVLCVWALGASYASFLREHKSLRYLITPANIIYGSLSLLGRSAGAQISGKLADLESPVGRTTAASPSVKPLVLFLVIGETARAQNFQLGGYARATNPELASRGVDYFPNVTSCGTSTAVSLPCMFSGSGRKSFDAATASSSTNLLDALAKAGVSVEWRDNNSGCKGICARVRSIDYGTTSSATLCNAKGCYDEVMLTDLADAVPKLTVDTVIVFHQAGSHGPAYSERYPSQFEIFKPVCYGNELSRCRTEEVVNAYDNSLLYTDHNLARQIDVLISASQAVDGVLLYVSDHGESLGEKGLYLHGAPYLLAPDEQTRVPFLMWMSAEYRKRFGISHTCVQTTRAQALSHDNLYHTVLGAMGVKSARYSAALDVLAACRSGEVAKPGGAAAIQ